jgi:hypothetical protein
MGSIRISETSQVGEVYNTVEYEFSDVADYFTWSEYKTKALSKAIKDYVGGLDGSEYDEPMTGEIKVAKKNTKH